jgi:2-succinyl-5-enolpyruvyl-6-hydroxy-3-cyclohexene-1-carboxylate synthase
MAIDFSNVNTVWASVLVETLYRLGLKTVVICPGSRSAPLAVAFAQFQQIEAIPVLDERSAAFFALGLARRTHQTIALICTSGTAGANFYPAIIEARESGVPLLVLTADRPPELRHCNAGQTIDQQKFFGSFPKWYAELAMPSLEMGMLAYLRQTIVHAWEQTMYPVPGPVHLNLPFREPLAPIPQPAAQALENTFPPDFFTSLIPPCEAWQSPPSSFTPYPSPLTPHPSSFISPPQWHAQRGIIIAGTAQPQNPQAYCAAIAHLSKNLGFPVLAEGLSPVRNYADLQPYLVSTYDLILRNPELAEKLIPDVVIRIGEMPTSKELRTWLATHQPQQWIIDPHGRNLDPLHGNTTHLRLSIEQLEITSSLTSSSLSPYCQQWCAIDTQVRQQIEQTMVEIDELIESKAAWLLPQILPSETPIFISSSMPVRDVEFFWSPNHRQIHPYFNRGANGIDGSLSTALGVAHHAQSSVMLTGDLALLHDTNGFLSRNHFAGHLTIILINNNGGGIFEMLPIAQFKPPFESFFATPQAIDFARLCATYNVQHELITTWRQLSDRLNSLPVQGIRVLELQTDRKRDAQWRKTTFAQIATNLTIR